MKSLYHSLARAAVLLWLLAPPIALTACYEDLAGANSINPAFEGRVAELLTTDTGQRRPTLVHNSILTRVARERALDMAERDYFNHTNPDGYGPNYLVRQAGYVLFAGYGAGDDANNIESIAAGYSTPERAWEGWMNSSGHKCHLLGEEQFYREQTEYGVGYAHRTASYYIHYWVVIIAKPGG